MAGVLIHDGRRPGHLKWSREAIEDKAADGVIINPFSTPRISIPRNPSATDISKNILEVGGEVIFDPMTQAALMDQTDRLDFYDGWDLWGASGKGLETDLRRREHIERVFWHQDQIGAPLLAPTLTVNAPLSTDATYAIQTAKVAQEVNSSTWQAVAGTRAFWASGARLDAYIGTLVSLKAPVWLVSVINETVEDNLPDLADTAAFEGLYRSIHSLSLRSRVIIGYSDFSGLPAVAAGADSVGSGWDRGQRTFDPMGFRQSDGVPRRSASYVTHGGLLSVLRRDAADAIERWDPISAFTMRGGKMPPSDGAERFHHFRQLRDLVHSINNTTPRKQRVELLLQRYSQAKEDYDRLIRDLRPTIDRHQKSMWVENPEKALRNYATNEAL